MQKAYPFFFCAFLFFFSSCTHTKDATNSPLFVLEQVKTAAEKADWKELTSHFCDKDKKKLETASTLGDLILGVRGKALVSIIKKQLFKIQEIDLENVVFKNEHIAGVAATVDVLNMKNEKTRTISFIKENGIWKICRQ
jgi:hypothetical protein